MFVRQEIVKEEGLEWPSFIEFDDENERLLIFASQKGEYSLWNLETFSKVWSIDAQKIEEIKTTPGFLMLIMKKPNRFRNLKKTHVSIHLHDALSGDVII